MQELQGGDFNQVAGGTHVDTACWEAMSPGGEPHTYRMAFSTSGGKRNFPVERCMGRAATRTAMQVKFFHWHVRDTVIILE